MELTAFNSRLGLSQGRLAVCENAYIFVFGDDTLAYEHNLTPGDHAEVVQETDLTDIDFIRTNLSVHITGGMPTGLTWEISIAVDGTKYASVRCDPGRARRITDLAANVSKIAGLHEVGVRLELVNA